MQEREARLSEELAQAQASALLCRAVLWCGKPAGKAHGVFERA